MEELKVPIFNGYCDWWFSVWVTRIEVFSLKGISFAEGCHQIKVTIQIVGNLVEYGQELAWFDTRIELFSELAVFGDGYPIEFTDVQRLLDICYVNHRITTELKNVMKKWFNSFHVLKIIMS